MSKITTHVLDVARGAPARGVPVTLERFYENGWHTLGRGATDDDGRVRAFTSEIGAGVHRLTFETGKYFGAQGVEGFFPEVSVVFEVRDANQHHHVPLLLSPFGYSTYRGS